MIYTKFACCGVCWSLGEVSELRAALSRSLPCSWLLEVLGGFLCGSDLVHKVKERLVLRVIDALCVPAN
eukprot:5457650-Amphidinium_carterae.2